MTESSRESTDDFAVQPVPIDQRRSTLSVSMVAMGFYVGMTSLFTGSAIVAGLTLRQAICVAFLGNLILAIYGGLIGAAGAKFGVSTAMLARHAFGRQGAKVVSGLWALILIGWFSVQTGFFGQTIHALVPQFAWTQPSIAALWGGLLMMLTAYFGFRGLEILSKIAIPTLAVLSLWGVVRAIGQGGGWAELMAVQPAESFTLGKGIVIVVGSAALGGVIHADISRYARSSSAAWLTSILGFVVGSTLMIVAGIVTTLATGSGNLPAAMLSVGLGVPGLLMLIALQWTTNDNNLYSASLGFANLFAINKRTIVFVCGVVATVIGFLGITEFFVPWLSMLGILIPAVAGVLIADVYIAQPERYTFGSDTSYERVSWPAFVAWGGGALAGWLIQAGIPCITSIIVAFSLHLFLMKVRSLVSVATQAEG